MDIRKNIIITCVSLFVCATLFANQKPYVTNLSRDKYHAANKNWSIGQDEKGIMYFGNSIGLLASDGMEWKLFQTPNASIVRAIAVESHQTIYSGGSEVKVQPIAICQNFLNLSPSKIIRHFFSRQTIFCNIQ